jgi:predicted nucleotidyltransferase
MGTFTIEVIITEDGEIQGEVQGTQGPVCEKLSEFLDEAGEVVEDRKKPEYHRRQTVGAHVRAGA